jgi:hypothetical protein
VVPAHAQGASLHGTVIVPSGSPIPQATITVEGPGGGQAATTNAAGQFTIDGLKTGAYKVRIASPGFEPFEVQVNVSGGSKEVDAVLRELAQTMPAAPAEETPSGQENQATPAPSAAPAQTIAAPQNLSVTAQKGKAAVYGVVSDQSGAVIQSGVATVTGPAGTTTVNADARGVFVLNGLAPGQYKLKVTAPGFAAFETDLTLTVNQAIELDAQLQPPTSNTEVNVEAGGPSQVQTESAHIEGTITEKEVVKTGLNGRNFTQLIALAPGVSNQTGQDEALVGVKGSVKYSVNGGRVEYNNFDVDGSDVLNAGLNGAESTLMVYPSLDAIQEVKVLTSNYGAQYGRSASGTVLVTTKSGAAKFHGVAYDFLRNEFFNARNYFDQTTKAPLYRRQDFGGTIGGPLYIPGIFNNKKDKAFFFWSEEFRLEKTPQEFNQAVPSAAERGIGTPNCPGINGIFGPCADFSDVCPVALGGGQASYSPAQFPDCPRGGADSSRPGNLLTFPGNLAPIDPTAAALLQNGTIPLPNSTTGCNSSLAGTPNITTGKANVPCYVATISPSTYWREELGRFDYNFTPTTQLSFRYIHDSWDTTLATPNWGIVENSFPTVQQKLIGPGTSMVVRLTDTFTPTLLNEFVVSYVNSHITLTNQNGPGANLQPIANCNTGSGLPPCIGAIFNNGFGGKPPGLVIGGTNGAYGGNGFTVDPSYAPWEHTNPTYSIADNISKSWGKHTVQFGVQVVDAQRNETNGAIGAATGDQQGILTFTNQNGGGYGNAFANFLLISPTGLNAIRSYQQDSTQLKYYNNYWIAEPYVQDDWRVNRRLTLNLGVRFSIFGNYHEKNLNAWNWDPNAFNTALASTVSIAEPGPGTLGGYLQIGKTPVLLDPNNPSANLNPVITNGLVQCGKNGIPDSCMQSHLFNPAPRIGFAWDPKGDGKTSIHAGYGIFYEHGTAKESNTGSLEGSAPNVLTVTQPFPIQYNSIGLGFAGGPHTAFPLDVTSIPTKTVWPYVQQWSFSVQRQFAKDIVATVAYVGSKGTHLPAELQINQLPVPPTGPDTGVVGNGNPFGPGQPFITFNPLGGANDCTYNPGLNNGPGTFVVNGITVNPNNAAWRNLVAACYGYGSNVPNPNSLRPFNGFQRVLALRDVGDSTYNALQATMRRTRGPLTVGASYTYSHSLDDSSDRSDATFVNSADIHANHASSNFDQRHLLSVNYIYDLPKLSGALDRWLRYSTAGDDAEESASVHSAQSESSFFRGALDGWQISGITIFQSGTPFSVINGGSSIGVSVLDNAGVANGAGTGSYPDVIGSPRGHLPLGVTKLNPQSIGPLLYNPAAFAAPQGLTFGNAGRNFLNNPHRLNFDMSILKTFKVTEGSNLEFRIEGFNVFNHTQFRIYNPNLGNQANNTVSCYAGAPSNYSAGGGYTVNNIGQPVPVDCTTGSSFLRPVDAHRPRTIQIGLKYSF